MARRDDRRTEGSLLFFVMLILAAGFLLVFLAKTRNGLPSDAINLNTASSEQLAVVLKIDPALAGLLTQYRERLGSFTQTHQPALLSVFPTSEARNQARAAIQKGIPDVNTADEHVFREVLNVSRPVAMRIVAYRDTLPGGRFRRPTDVARVPIVDDSVIASLGDRLIVRTPGSVFVWFGALGGVFGLSLLVVAILLRKAGVSGDPYLLPIVYLLTGLGIITLFSIKDPLRDTPVYTHQIAAALLALVALLAGGLLPAERRRNSRRYTYVWALAALGLLASLWLFGSGPEGVRLSISFFQPVEVIKLLLVFFLAGYLTEHGDRLADALHRWSPAGLQKVLGKNRGIAAPRREDLGPMIGMYAAALLLFLAVKDMGPALLLFGTFLGLLYIATGRSGLVVVGVCAMALGGMIAYSAHLGVLPVRVHMWLSPWSNSHPNGMQLGQALWGMASGGLYGSGLGLGQPGAMPRAGSDLVFASVGEDLGLIGSLAVLVLYVLLIARGLRIALRAQNDFDRLLAAGLTVLVACQVFLIVAGVTGLLPLSGVTLPFMSYGGSSLVASFFLIGLLRAISSKRTRAESVPLYTSNPLFGRTARRFATASALALLGLVGVGRLFWVQALAADRVAGNLIRTPDADGVVRAKINPRLAAIEAAIPRGSIYDRKGKVLATSRLDEISAAVGDDADLARRYYRAGRYYPRGPYCAHLIGYLNRSIGGPTGLEAQFNRELRGFDSYAELLADYRAKDLPYILTGVRAKTGKDVVLTIDADLQEEAMGILKQAASTITDKRTGRHKDRAAIVMLDPTTGEVLVSAAIPSYDPNVLSPARWNDLLANADKSNRLVDRARFGLYPPGSTIKVVTGAAGLEEGIEPIYDCHHVATDLRWTYKGQTYSRRTLQDDKGEEPHGRIGMDRAIKVSCNLYFANLGMRLGPKLLREEMAGADRFALRNVAPLDLFARDLPDNAFGQGTMQVTPTEMARVAATVANHGSMMQPTYWREVREHGGASIRKNTPALMSRPMGEINAQRMAAMMRTVVTGGTASGVFSSLPVEVAGKTGTAQNEQADKQPHSWFIGYAPFSRPQYAFACIIENGGYGKRGAAPACRDLLAQVYGKQ